MPVGSPDLHGSAPDKSPYALLLIDVINDLEFPGGELLLKHAIPTAKKIAALKNRAKQHGVPVVYVNDNFGRWQSDFSKQVRHCLDDGVRGQQLTEILHPDEDDYFVLKPKHSGFFSTTLDTLLEYLGSQTLVLTGFAGNICVLYTANDAYMRDYQLIVPSDCMASELVRANKYALDQMKRYLKADIRPSSQVRFSAEESDQ
jgi:nicotinamidase-related amidase